MPKSILILKSNINPIKNIIMNSRNLFVPLALVILLGLFATVSFGCWNIPEDRSTGNFIKEERNVSNFTRLEIGGAYEVHLSQGDQEKLVIEADADEIKEIVTEVVGSKLKIYTKSGWGERFHEMTIYLTFKNLDNIDFSGAVEVSAESALTFSELEMDVSGAAEIDLEMRAEKFTAEFSGASEIDFRGVCKTGDIEISGASEFDAEGLQFEELSIELSGASEARIFATNKLNVDASGASEIRYKGNPPNISIDESGASSIKPM
jgi:hypothetical protein